MVAKSKKTGAKKGRVKVGKLKLNKETVRDLSKHEGKDIMGGRANKSFIPGDCPQPKAAI